VSRRPPPGGRSALALLAIVLVALVLPVHAAGADALGSERAHAAELAAQIDADNQRVDSLTARYEAAQLAAGTIDRAVIDAAAAVHAAQARIAATRAAVRDLAVREFIQQGSQPDVVTTALRRGDLHGTELARLFSDVAVRKDRDVLDASHAAEEDLRTKLEGLDAQQTRAHQAADALHSARRTAAAAVRDEQTHLHEIQGKLASLVAAERARHAAAREASTRAAVQHRTPAPRPGGASPTHAVDGRRAAIAVEEARQQLGKPYQWGAAGPDSFDCSGLTMWSWRKAGVDLPHYTGAQYSSTVHIPLSELRPGDLVFFRSDVSHVGIYVGNGQMIHAPHTGDVVRYASNYSEGSPVYAGRVTG
jgi:cell wall-associated NlpC family hydrolase